MKDIFTCKITAQTSGLITNSNWKKNRLGTENDKVA